ncbi:MAG TPA: hypothetical protein VEH81_10610 [Ktedonobacteraceae bacterium]|nr:hypothetical protein [Ktedonobacteraceae bacterium]
MIEEVISTLYIPDNISHISSSVKREAIYEKFRPMISVNRAFTEQELA